MSSERRHIGRFSIDEDHEGVAVLLSESGSSVGIQGFASHTVGGCTHCHAWT